MPPRVPEGEKGDSRRVAKLPFVSVAVRIRPSSEEPAALWATEKSRVCCNRGFLLEEYEFSRVFGPEEDNQRLFAQLQGPAITDSIFAGVNETLFAYGQTGSGKTHTIFGSASSPGLLELFVQQVFDTASLRAGSAVHACCYEVLGDSLTDLIDSSALEAEGALCEDDVVHDELFIKTQRCRYQICRVPSAELCLRLLRSAARRRSCGVSSVNGDSSRSHAIVQLFVQNPCEPPMASIGTLTLVDLAGSEKEHENPSLHGRKSARLLNTSLCSLNRLLRKLQTGCLDESERRQSVLNKCLWEYLRPGCGIALIFCVNPSLQHRAASLSTLAMATDSKLIHSQRKCQYIQLSPHTPHETIRQVPSSPSPRGTPAPPPRSAETPRRPAGITCTSPRQESARREETNEEPEFQRQLAQSARHYERLRLEAERAHDELASDNMALRRECESLRGLFVRQQQQQIAFWTGPFLEMVGENSAAKAMAKMAAKGAQEALAAVQQGEKEDSLADAQSLSLDGVSRCVMPEKTSAQKLRAEMEYWRDMALTLQRELHKSKSPKAGVSDTETRSSRSASSDGVL
ncbi:unnamed protein product [Effrenium voratum]|uniref:Kinesin-like protein n=1 Tax=Effrenium voratum TaxID=2562239 RepID=A0AA36IJ76_9DINO|nr:unnamed protein product [Effrenium voratum]